MHFRVAIAVLVAGGATFADESDRCTAKRTDGWVRGVRDRQGGVRAVLFPVPTSDRCEIAFREEYRAGYDNAPEPWLSPPARTGRSLVITGVGLVIPALVGIVLGGVGLASAAGSSCGPRCDEGGSALSGIFLGIGLGEGLIGTILMTVGAFVWDRAPLAR